MKKIIIALLLTSSFAVLTACSGAPSSSSEASSSSQSESVESEESAETEESSSEAESESEESKASESEFDMGGVLNGTNYHIGMIMDDDILSSLGEPTNTMEAPSCHFDGNDTIYYYSDITLYTYKDGDKNVVYLIELLSENAPTALGATTGMTKADIEAIYGSDYEMVGTRMSYTLEKEILEFTTDESDTITMIEILELA